MKLPKRTLKFTPRSVSAAPLMPGASPAATIRVNLQWDYCNYRRLMRYFWRVMPSDLVSWCNQETTTHDLK
jgi:hypothetical protein